MNCKFFGGIEYIQTLSGWLVLLWNCSVNSFLGFICLGLGQTIIRVTRSVGANFVTETEREIMPSKKPEGGKEGDSGSDGESPAVKAPPPTQINKMKYTGPPHIKKERRQSSSRQVFAFTRLCALLQLGAAGWAPDLYRLCCSVSSREFSIAVLTKYFLNFT